MKDLVVMWVELLGQVQQGNYKSLARTISLIENQAEGYEDFLKQFSTKENSPIIGITGPPGAGKSTLINGLIEQFIFHHKKVGVLCIDPSSPFSLGALLGDRIRMSNSYNHPDVFIRSMATRGSLGGLHPQIIEVLSVMQSAWFDYIIVETVGIGQSEIEIAALADTTVVVLVPEGGDEIQTMKAGLMEIADIFVVNKADRPDANTFEKNLIQMQAAGTFNYENNVPILKTVASENKGIDILYETILEHVARSKNEDKQLSLLAEKAFYLIRQHRMKNIDKSILKKEIKKEIEKDDFNLYRFLTNYINY